MNHRKGIGRPRVTLHPVHFIALEHLARATGKPVARLLANQIIRECAANGVRMPTVEQAWDEYAAKMEAKKAFRHPLATTENQENAS